MQRDSHQSASGNPGAVQQLLLRQPKATYVPVMSSGHKTRRRFLDQPELNILIFALLLNYPWEFLQAPFFQEMPGATHWEAVKVCTRAAFGDSVIMLIAYCSVAVAVSDRWWIQAPSRTQMLGFIAAGVAITVAIEHFAIRSTLPAWGWRYADTMPTLPVVGVGLTPLLQWILLPPLAIWFVRRQLKAVPVSDSSDR